MTDNHQAAGQPIIVWCDLEMTGLEPANHAILELGLIITRSDLKPLAEFEVAIWQPEEVLARMEPYVRDMHTRNGLLERVRNSTHSLRNAEHDACSKVLEFASWNEAILAGNSIHTDRSFITRYMPGFDRLLHYRMIDVSSIKLLTRAWYPRAPGRSKVEAAHTAMADLRESIAELAYYRQTFFKSPADV